MSVWDVLGVLFVLFSAAILVPRVHITAEFGKDKRILGLAWRWLNLRMDFQKDQFSGNILFRKFPREERKVVEPIESTYQALGPETKPPEKDRPQTQPTEPITESEPEPDHEPYKTDYPEYDSTHEPPKNKKFKLPKIKFGWKVKKAAPDNESKPDGEDKWFWLKYAWRERGLGLDLLKGVFRSMGRFIHHIRTDYCNIDLSLGTGDPMTTAIAVGSLESAVWLLRRHGRVEIAPLFEEERFDIAVSCSFSMRPYQAVGVFVWYLVTLPWVRIVRVGWDVKGRVFGK